jgi:hypothetical protein
LFLLFLASFGGIKEIAKGTGFDLNKVVVSNDKENKEEDSEQKQKFD